MYRLVLCDKNGTELKYLSSTDMIVIETEFGDKLVGVSIKKLFSAVCSDIAENGIDSQFASLDSDAITAIVSILE